LDRRRETPGIAREARAILWMSGEGEECVAEEVRRRFMAGDQQEEAEAEKLVVSEGPTIHLGGKERAHEVVAWCGAALGKEAAEVLGERLGGGNRSLAELGGGHVGGVRATDEVARPRAKRGTIPRRDPHELRDDGRRQRPRELVDEV